MPRHPTLALLASLLTACVDRPADSPSTADTTTDVEPTTTTTTPADGTTIATTAPSTTAPSTTTPGTTTTPPTTTADPSTDDGPKYDIGPLPDLPPTTFPGCDDCDPAADYCCSPFTPPDLPDALPDECNPLPPPCLLDPTCACVVDELPGATLETCQLWTNDAVHIGDCLR